ncbi:MAG: TetR/AcrR family transcriptional regulator [Syntrophales bacterium]|nr:TetR/AcrR family transcriptional regulator [Syntrophales bacterium]
MKDRKTFSDLRRGEIKSRQELIVQAAERVFAVKPFDRVSIRDIAREAGISHASIYRYFPDQQSLFVEAFVHGAEAIIASLQAVIAREDGDIVQASETYINYLVDNEPYFRMMTKFMLDGSLSAELLDRLNTAERRLFDVFDRLFRKEGLPEPVRPLSHALFAALNGVLITFWNYPGRTAAEVRRHMLQVAAHIARRFQTKG